MAPPNISSPPPCRSNKKPPMLLHWRGMKRWSIGKRAPSLCNMIMNTKSSSAKLGLFMVGKLIRSYTSRSRSGTPTNQDELAHETQDGANSNVSHLELSSTQVESVSESIGNVSECDLRLKGATLCMARSTSCPNPQSYAHDYHSNSINTTSIMSFNNCIPRRHSDATNLPRAYSNYRAFHTANHEQDRGAIGLEDIPRILKLGNSSSKKSSSSSSSNNAQCQFRDSPAMSMAKIKDTCSRILTISTHKADNNAELFGDLLVGNQFLAHVNPAPLGISGSAIAWRNSTPSSGLVDASLKCRNSQLKDRLVFFV